MVYNLYRTYRIGHHNIHSTIYNINKRKDDEAVGNDQ